MLQFHVIVQAATKPWPITFDAAYAALEQVPGIFLEPDGSFFLPSRPGEPRWQVEGNLYDQGERLAYAEIKGCCPDEWFDDLLQPLGWPQVLLKFQMVREGQELSEKEFRKVTRIQGGREIRGKEPSD